VRVGNQIFEAYKGSFCQALEKQNKGAADGQKVAPAWLADGAPSRNRKGL
jgi:hypothetical protein